MARRPGRWHRGTVPHPRPIDLPAALLLATAALALAVAAGCAFLLVAVIGIAGRDAVALDGDAWTAVCAAGAVACGSVAALIALTRSAGGLRPRALAAVWLLGFAWPLAPLPLPAAIAATLASALAVHAGPRAGCARDDAPAVMAFAAISVALLAAAVVGGPSVARVAPAAPRAVVAPRTAGTEEGGSVCRGGSSTRSCRGAARTRRTVPAEAGLARSIASLRRYATQPRDRAAALSQPNGFARPDRALPSMPAVRRRTRSGPDGATRVRAGGPGRVVNAYYRALDARDFAAAWRVLSPGVRAGFGGRGTWRAGFARTVSSRPEGIAVSGGATAATVRLVLTARDRAACGVATRRYAVTWSLELRGTAWRAAAVAGTPLGASVC